jgi:hypothetical protein
MNTTDKAKAAFDTLTDEALDHVAGGINPQPLPPRDPNPHDARAQ